MHQVPGRSCPCPQSPRLLLASSCRRFTRHQTAHLPSDQGPLCTTTLQTQDHLLACALWFPERTIGSYTDLSPVFDLPECYKVCFKKNDGKSSFHIGKVRGIKHGMRPRAHTFHVPFKVADCNFRINSANTARTASWPCGGKYTTSNHVAGKSVQSRANGISGCGLNSGYTTFAASTTTDVTGVRSLRIRV